MISIIFFYSNTSVFTTNTHRTMRIRLLSISKYILPMRNVFLATQLNKKQNIIRYYLSREIEMQSFQEMFIAFIYSCEHFLAVL